MKKDSKKILVGLTYDLKQDYLDEGYSKEAVAEFDSLDTIEGIEKALEAKGYSTTRIGNIKALNTFLAKQGTVDIVFNIAEGINGLGREAQIPALLDAFAIDYVFSTTEVLAVSLHKGFTKAVVLQQGVLTPPYCCINTSKEIEKLNEMKFPVFLKPVSGGTGIGIDSSSFSKDLETAKKTALKLLKTYKQPVLVEENLPGREFTTGIVGTGEKAKVLGTMEIIIDKSSDNGIYSYKTKQNYKKCASYELTEGKMAEDCSTVALKAYKALGIRDGGRIDLKLDSNGRVNFIEVNPLAGLNPIDSDLPILCRKKGISYDDLIGMIMASAMERLKK